MKESCPHCGSPNAWYVRTETDLVLKCTCGVNKVVFSTLGTMEMEHNDAPQEARLPRTGTFLHATLMALMVLEIANSREVTERLKEAGYTFSVSDVSSYLTILRAKGLVVVLEARRGTPGGSTWQLSDVAEDLLSP